MLKPCLGPGESLRNQPERARYFRAVDELSAMVRATHPAVWSIIEWRCLPWWKRWWELVRP